MPQDHSTSMATSSQTHRMSDQAADKVQSNNSSHSDPTFRTNTIAAAEAYQAGRPGYSSTLLTTLLSHHTKTGGQFNTLLDVGCGPGTATRLISPRFQTAYGADPSPSMIATALTIPTTTLSGNPIGYAVGPAESLSSIPFAASSTTTTMTPLAPSSVDLITCAMSAHWFTPISSFYACAAHLLRPGGTLAMWTSSSYYCHPHSTPNAAAVQAILTDLESRILGPYEMPGNRLSKDAYENLPLPWDFISSSPSSSSGSKSVEISQQEKEDDHDAEEEATAALSLFDASTFVRKEWNRNGHVEPGEKFFAAADTPSGGYTLDEFARGCSTSSMVVRWREANAEKLARGEVEDCVDATVRKLREVLDGKDRVEGGPAVVLLMIKKKM